MPDPSTEGWQHGIDQLACDREHGAAEIVRRATSILAEAFEPENSPDTIQRLKQSLHRLRFGHPSMAPVLRLTARLWQFADKYSNPSNQPADSEEDLRRRWVDLLTDIGKEQDRKEHDLLEHLRNAFRQETSLALYSSSSTVRKGLEVLADELRTIPIYVGLSIPGEEGKEVAQSLVDFGYRPVLVTDAHLADLLIQGKVGTLVLGCDAFDPRRFINKIGSGSLAALATAGKGKAELWTTGTKYLKSIDELEIDVQDGSEYDDGDNQFRFTRPLFGAGSLEDISSIRCERGCIEPGKDDPGSFFDSMTIPNELKLGS